MTYGTFIPCPSPKLRAFWFPFALLPIQGLRSPLRCTPWHVFLNVRQNAEAHCPTIASRIQVFSIPIKGSFQHSLTVLVLYRTKVVFTVGSRCLPDSRTISRVRYSGYLHIFLVFLYGAITLYGPSFQMSLSEQAKTKRRSYNPTSPFHFWKDSVCRLPCSVALTSGISIDFFSCRY